MHCENQAIIKICGWGDLQQYKYRIYTYVFMKFDGSNPISIPHSFITILGPFWKVVRSEKINFLDIYITCSPPWMFDWKIMTEMGVAKYS